jgi:hypothetical protein
LGWDECPTCGIAAVGTTNSLELGLLLLELIYRLFIDERGAGVYGNRLSAASRREEGVVLECSTDEFDETVAAQGMGAWYFDSISFWKLIHADSAFVRFFRDRSVVDLLLRVDVASVGLD